MDDIRHGSAAALRQAFAKAGKRCALAAELGVTPQALSQWRRVPAQRVLDVERATGVPRYQLRPDLYPPDSSGVTA